MSQKTADKSVTIKGASDEGLSKLLRRLEMESRVQELVRRLRANSKDRNIYTDEFDISEWDKGVDLSTPVSELYHFGIKGMKWGVRRGRNVAKKYGTETKTKSVKDLSDQELNKRLNRIRMEREYARLTAPQKSAGRQYVEGLLKDAGNQVAKDFVTSVMKTVAKGPKDKAIAKIAKSLEKKR